MARWASNLEVKHAMFGCLTRSQMGVGTIRRSPCIYSHINSIYQPILTTPARGVSQLNRDNVSPAALDIVKLLAVYPIPPCSALALSRGLPQLRLLRPVDLLADRASITTTGARPRSANPFRPMIGAQLKRDDTPGLCRTQCIKYEYIFGGINSL